MTKKTAIIIGAGYGGMALANLLGKAGYKVDVFEKNQVAGGRINAVRRGGYLFDQGPSWYLMPEVFAQYYSLFDADVATRLDVVPFTPAYKVFFEKHKPLVVHGSVAKDAPSFEAIEPGAGKKLERYVQKSSLAYEISVKYFLYNNFLRVRDVLRPDVLRHALAMCGLLTKTLHTYVGQNFTDIRLQQILEYQMVFLGSSPFQAPAIYTLMSHLDFKSGVFYPRQGMLSLVDDMLDLGKKYDITYHYGAGVQQILVAQGKAVGVQTMQGARVTADIVISNADLQHTETTMLSKQHQSFDESYWRKRQPGPSALLISLGVKGKLPQLLHHNLYFVDDWRQNFTAIYDDKVVPNHASIYVCNPTKTDPTLAPKSHENLFILMPIAAGVQLSAQQQESLADQAITALAAAIDAPDLADRVTQKVLFGPGDFAAQFNAWDYNAFGGESHILRQSINFRTPNKSRKVQNLFYVGAGTLPGIGLPMCLIGAQLTFKRIVGSRHAGPLQESMI